MQTLEQRLSHTLEVFEGLGGEFHTPVGELARRLAQLRALVFDWDGVFCHGAKGEGVPSTYNEADTAGINAMRYALFRMTGQVPAICIVSGQQNESAVQLAERDRYQACYFRMSDKRIAVQDFCQCMQIDPGQCSFMFDDAIDLSVAQLVGIRMMVSRKAAPIFREFVSRKKLADYMSSTPASGHAIRECMEMLLSLSGEAENVFFDRLEHNGKFRAYTFARNGMPWMGRYTEENGMVVKLA